MSITLGSGIAVDSTQQLSAHMDRLLSAGRNDPAVSGTQQADSPVTTLAPTPHSDVAILHPFVVDHLGLALPLVAQVPTLAQQVAGPDAKPIDFELLALADHAYGRGTAPEPWKVVPTEQFDEWGISDEELATAGLVRTSDGYLVDANTGLQATLYTDGNGNYVLAFAGTEFTDVTGDWWEGNYKQANGEIGPQYVSAIKLGLMIENALREDGEGGTLIITGHSLGGGLATAVALATGATAVVFNPAGLHPDTIDYALQQREEVLGDAPPRDEAITTANDGQVRRLTVEGEILTTFQEDLDEATFIAAAVAAGFSPRAARALYHIHQMQHTPLGAEVELGQSIPGLGNSQVHDPIALHSLDAVNAGLADQVPQIIDKEPQSDGTVMLTIQYPTSATSYQTLTVRFEDEQAAAAFESDFRVSGSMPPANGSTEVVSRTSTDEYSTRNDGFALALEELGVSGLQMQHFQNDLYADASGLVVTHRDDGSIESAELTMYSTDGTQVVIQMSFDEAGNEIRDERTYLYTTTPATQAEADTLNHTLYSEDDWIEPGVTYTLELQEEDMIAIDVDLAMQEQQGTLTDPESQLLLGTGDDVDNSMVVASNLAASRGHSNNGLIGSLLHLWGQRGDDSLVTATPPDEDGVIKIDVATPED